MAHLPPEMISEILSRCPVKSLFRFKSVSSAWLAMISDPYLISQQHRRAPASLLLDAYTHIRDGHLVYSYGPRNEEPNKLHRFLHFGSSSNGELHDLVFIGSPNGVVCAIRYPQYQEFTLWNPATRSSMLLPAPRLGFDPSVHSRACVGLGFVPSPGHDAGEYKAIRLLEFQKDDRYDQVEVLSVNLGRWERLMTHEEKMRMMGKKKLLLVHERCCVAKGFPYWRATKVDPVTRDPATGYCREKLVWFNWNAGAEGCFVEEEFAWPTEKGPGMLLGAMNDCLCALVSDFAMDYSGVWVKEGEGTRGWIFKYRLVINPGMWDPVGFCGPKGIVMRCVANRGRLRIYDLDSFDELGQINIDQNLILQGCHLKVLGYTESLTDPLRQLLDTNFPSLRFGNPR